MTYGRKPYPDAAQEPLNESYTYNDFGELAQMTASCGGTLRTLVLSRDDTGLITRRDETVAGQTSSSTFGFDANGRLTTIADGNRTATYTYDGQGNRQSVARPDVETYQYDAQDRLVQRGATTYTYAADGWLQTKTEAAETTRYAYDLFGNLRTADLPNGKKLTYLVDGGHRRIGKQVDGVLVQGSCTTVPGESSQS